MLKMTIDNEEVVSDKDITINEEMLSASSTILNNVYPKEWEEDKDYTSRFYYPQDYSKALIQRSYVTQEAEAGTTIQVNGSATLTDVDTTKNSRVLRLLGQTSQNGTPTPSSPIPVNVVSGDNKITVCGKNLFNKDNVRAGYRFGSDGDYYASSGYNATEYIGVQPNTLYSVSWTMLWDEVVCTYDINKTFVRRLQSGTNFTTSANEYYIRADVSDAHLDTAQIEKNSSATTYEPYQGNTYNIDLPVENLCNNDNVLGLFLNYTNSTIGEADGSKTMYAKVPKNTDLTVSRATLTNRFRIGLLNEIPQNGGTFYLVYNGDSEQLLSKTINSGNYEYVAVQYTNQGENSNIQIEAGTKANSYTPYGTTPIELCKIGTYQDYIYKDSGKWYIEKQIGKVVLNGSEGVQREDTSTSGNYRFDILSSVAFKYGDASYVGEMLCNKLLPTSRNGTYLSQQGIAPFNLSGDFYCQVYIEATKTLSIADFKTWLSNNHLIVYGVLQTSTNTEITYQPLIEQLNALSSQ